MRTTVVAVSYNSSAVLGQMIASVVSKCAIIVVDNSSKDNSIDVAKSAGAEVVSLKSNIGFGPASNVGAKLAQTEFLLFLNPDAVVLPDAIEKLETAADTYKDASAFNPAISDAKGDQNFKRRSKLLPRNMWMKTGWPNSDCEIPILSGAALFCRRECFNKVGGFDPEIFLYHEDDDLALRLKEVCGPLIFVRSAKITHQEGRSSPRSSETARIKSYHMARSSVYAMRKHKRPMPFLTNLTAAILKIISPLILVSPRKRAQAIAFMRGVWSMR
ncbi:MAG: glycosyltransferase family 2 protein [Notoacmeibacter sp.]